MNNFKTFYESKTDNSRTHELIRGLYEIKEMTESPSIGFKWIDIKPYIRELKHTGETRIKGAAHLHLPASEHSFAGDYSIHVRAVDRWDNVMVEYPACAILSLVANPHLLIAFDTNSLCAEVSKITRGSMSIDMCHTLKQLGRLANILKTQIKASQILRELPKPADIETAIDILDSFGIDKTTIIKLKRKHGVEIDPNEIDDKTLVDLL